MRDGNHYHSDSNSAESDKTESDIAGGFSDGGESLSSGNALDEIQGEYELDVEVERDDLEAVESNPVSPE